MGRQVPVGSCWMTTKTSIMRYQISLNSTAYRSFNTTRMIAFLADPSDDNWRKFKADSGPNAAAGTRAIDHPFSHRCHRGPAYDNQDNGKMRCINGLEHGRFSTKEENECAKVCGLVAARPICPGHGDNHIKCLFTHENGHPKPCLNVDGWVPPCHCQPRCY